MTRRVAHLPAKLAHGPCHCTGRLDCLGDVVTLVPGKLPPAQSLWTAVGLLSPAKVCRAPATAIYASAKHELIVISRSPGLAGSAALSSAPSPNSGLPLRVARMSPTQALWSF